MYGKGLLEHKITQGGVGGGVHVKKHCAIDTKDLDITMKGFAF